VFVVLALVIHCAGVLVWHLSGWYLSWHGRGGVFFLLCSGGSYHY
jgi:hypothetical protein